MFAGADLEQEDVNPMDSTGNLADVMLVFACGLLLALIINWNVDVSAQTEHVEPDVTYEELEQLPSGEAEALDTDVQYEKLEVAVYRDPVTGKMYMVQANENDVRTNDG